MNCICIPELKKHSHFIKHKKCSIIVQTYKILCPVLITTGGETSDPEITQNKH